MTFASTQSTVGCGDLSTVKLAWLLNVEETKRLTLSVSSRFSVSFRLNLSRSSMLNSCHLIVIPNFRLVLPYVAQRKVSCTP